jgi:hypothetical protein
VRFLAMPFQNNSIAASGMSAFIIMLFTYQLLQNASDYGAVIHGKLSPYSETRFTLFISFYKLLVKAFEPFTTNDFISRDYSFFHFCNSIIARNTQAALFE